MGNGKISRIIHFIYSVLPFCLVVAGIALRVRQYFFNRSLWIDEAQLAVVLTQGSYLDFFKPLGETQHAPVGFLLLEKFIISPFGNSEFSLRLIPLLAGCVSLVLIYRVSRSLIGKKAAVIALTIFALADPLIYYSTEMKQYATDVFVVLVCYAYFIVSKPRHWITAGLIGALLIWFSHPIVLVLFAILLATWPRYGKPSVLWFISIVINFAVITRTYYSDSSYNIWVSHFLFVPNLTNVLSIAGTPKAATFALLSLGLVLLWKRKKYSIIVLFLTPICLTVVSSLLKIYPFTPRLLLFLAPSITITIAIAILEIIRYARLRGGIIGMSLAVLVIYAGVFKIPFFQTIEHLYNPYKVEEIKPVLEYIEKQRMPGDELYVYGGFDAYRYYMPRYHLTTVPTLFRIAPRFEHSALITDLDRIRGKSRVWILFSHVLSNPDSNSSNDSEFITSYLDKIGRRLDQIQVIGSSAYVYDLSTNP